jgi:hypothetical protein
MKLLAKSTFILHPVEIVRYLSIVKSFGRYIDFVLVGDDVVDTGPSILLIIVPSGLGKILALPALLDENQLLASILSFNLIHVTLDEATLPTSLAAAMCLKNRTLAVKGTQIFSATLGKILAQIMRE